MGLMLSVMEKIWNVILISGLPGLVENYSLSKPAINEY
jgi:hypothetical protein